MLIKTDKKDSLLIFWEIIAVIHTFAGSIMIATITPILVNSPALNIFAFAIGSFFLNFWFIKDAYNWKTSKINTRSLTFTFWLAMVTMLLFTISLIISAF